MSYVEKVSVTVTTDASGDGTEYTPVMVGKVRNIIYTKGDYDAGVDFAITNENTDQDIWSEDSVDASKTVSPRQEVHNAAGNVLVNDIDGSPIIGDICLDKDRIKIVVANGGNAKTGQFWIVVG